MIWCVPKGGRRDEARLLKPLAAQLKASTNQIYASDRDMRGVGEGRKGGWRYAESWQDAPLLPVITNNKNNNNNKKLN